MRKLTPAAFGRFCSYSAQHRGDFSGGRNGGNCVTESQRSAQPRSSIIATIIDKLVALCGVVPYALVALGLRFIVARVFFMSGQMKIVGPVIPVPLIFRDEPFAVTLPAEIKASTFELFAKEYSALPMSPTLAATLFTYAEFLLPICLVLGFATRLSALLLLILTVLIQVYVAPKSLWTAHIYLFALLMVRCRSAPAQSRSMPSSATFISGLDPPCPEGIDGTPPPFVAGL